jgi:non-heme chloroperoxidase
MLSQNPSMKSIQLFNRVKLPYAEQGDPAGIPMVMLHGVTDSWHSFEPVLPHLPASIHAFALTQRGHGDADRPAMGYRARDFASDVAAFVDALALGRVVVVGHSMGASNAIRFALDYPERTASLVLAGAFAGYRDNPVIEEFFESAIAPLTDPIDPAFVREFQQSTLAQPIPEAFLELAVRESLKVPARVWRAAFEAFQEDDAASELGKIDVPTLILWGAHDQISPRGDQDKLLRGIAHSRLKVYDNAGHALHWEEPRRFAEDLAEFARTSNNTSLSVSLSA